VAFFLHRSQKATRTSVSKKADRLKGQIDFDLIGFAAGMKLAAMLTKRAGALPLAFWGNKESEDE